MTKSFKAVLSLVMTVIMVLALVACGTAASKEQSAPKEQNSGKQAKITDAKENAGTEAKTNANAKELKFWIFHGEEDGRSYFVDFCKKYNDTQKDAVVSLEKVPLEDYLNGTKLLTAFAAGEGPDVFLASPATIGSFVNSKVALPLDKYLTDKIKSDFSPSSLEGVTFDNQIYGIPYEIELVGLYYDQDVLDKAGVKPPKTWSELKEVALKVKTDKMAGLTIPLTKDGYQSFVWYPFMWMTGADVFTPDKKHSALDNPGVGKSLAFWRDLAVSGAINMKPSRHASQIDILADNESAMQFTVCYAPPYLEKKYPDKKINVVPMPVPDENGKPSSVAGGWKLLVNSKSKNVDDAAKFAVWLFGENVENAVDYCTKAKFAYSPRKSVIEAAKSEYSRGIRKVFTDQILGTEKPELRMPPEIGNIIQDMIQKALFDTKTPIEEIVKSAHEKVEEFLKDYKGSI